MKILLADNNEINKMITQQMLTQKNIDSDCVSNSSEVIEKLYHEPYSMVFMDLNMLDADTSNVEQILKEEFLNTSLVAYVNEGEKPSLASYKNRGIDEVILKPFELVDLCHTIEKHTNHTVPQDEQESVIEFKKSLLAYSDYDSHFALELVDCFINNYKEYQTSAKEAFQLRDENQLQESWHKISSSNKIFSISSLDVIREKLTTTIKANPSSGDPILINELVSACDVIISKLNAIKQNLQS